MSRSRSFSCRGHSGVGLQATLRLRAPTLPRGLAVAQIGAHTRFRATLESMWIGWIELDLLLGDVHSLKEKRSFVRPLISELRRRFELSVAEVDHLDLHRRVMIGVSVVAAERAHVVEVLDSVEHFVAARPEFEFLSAHRQYRTSYDE